MKYNEVLEDIWLYGEPVTVRGMETLELPNYSVHFQAGQLVARKGMNRALGWVEMLMFIGGIFEPDALKAAAPKADHSLFTPNMAYGPRVVGQLHNVVDALRYYPTSRQAVMYIANPGDSGEQPPCTLSMQFMIRGGKLNSTVTMRSWDAIKGIPYDIMMFGGMTQAIARCLFREPGQVTVNAGSLHLYMSDIPTSIPEVNKHINGGPMLNSRNAEQFRLRLDVPSDIGGLKLWARSAVLNYPWPDRVPPGVIVE